MMAPAIANLSQLQVVFCAVLIVVAAAMALVDLRSMVLPDSMNVALGAAGILQSAVLGYPGVSASCIGAVAGLFVLASVAVLFRRLRGIDGLGAGDQKFAAASGLWIGWQGIPPMLLVASVAAILYAAVLALVVGNLDRSTRIPFGPFLALGLISTWIWISILGQAGE